MKSPEAFGLGMEMGPVEFKNAENELFAETRKRVEGKPNAEEVDAVISLLELASKGV